MATTNPFVSAMLLFALLITLSFDFTVGEIGIVYGRNGNNLLSPHDVVELYKRHNIWRMRTYDPDSAVLDALRGSGIELTAVITNQFLENLARDQNTANDWVRDHVLNFPDVNYKYISVGNEVSPADGATARYAQFVLPAMRNVYRAICRAGRASRIKITTTVGMSVLGNSYPPEAGAFRDDVAPYLRPILWFITNTGAPFMANIYPYFAYIYNRAQIDLGYALLEPNHGLWINGVYYDNLFYAMVDAVYAAMERMIGGQSLHKAVGEYNRTAEHKAGRSKGRPKVMPWDAGFPSKGGEYNQTAQRKAGKRAKTKVVAGETGFPSYGNNVANTQNAKTYNQNLVDVVDDGTPRNPEPIETYMYILNNQSNWDLFKLNKTVVPEAMAKSAQASKNRCSEPAGPGTGKVVHFGGSRNTEWVADDLAKADNLPMGLVSYRVMKKMHYKNGVYTDGRSKLLIEEVERLIAEARQPLPGTTQSRRVTAEMENAFYAKVVKLDSRGRQFGQGCMSQGLCKSLYTASASQTQTPVPDPRVSDLESRFERLEQSLVTRVDLIQSALEEHMRIYRPRSFSSRAP